MVDSNTVHASLMGIYTKQFTQDWKTVVQKAAHAFRTDETVKTVMAELETLTKLAGQADTLVSSIEAGKVKGKEAGKRVSNLLDLLKAQQASLDSALKGVEGLDIKTLTKAASLDQPGLKTLAAELKSGADAALNINIATFIGKVSAGLETALSEADEQGVTDSKTQETGKKAPTLTDNDLKKLSTSLAAEKTTMTPDEVDQLEDVSGVDDEDDATGTGSKTPNTKVPTLTDNDLKKLSTSLATEKTTMTPDEIDQLEDVSGVDDEQDAA